MRYFGRPRIRRRERVARRPLATKDAEALVGERAPLHAVEVENGRVRREAGPDGRDRVVLGPIDKLGQRGNPR